MRFPSFDEAEVLKATWTDKLVRVRAGLPEYTRFAGMIGRVVTVNYGGRALVDFADGGWYDIPATDAHLEVVTDPAATFDATANSAQKLPHPPILTPMILLIDNYDSFTYNLVQRFGEIDPSLPMTVVRNDQITLAEIGQLDPTHIILSPGPCTPKEAGICNDVLKEFAPTRPVFGVCLGHQCIGHTFGGEVIRNSRIMHGKVSPIHHDGRGVFAGMSNPFDATRYHSLVIKRETWTNPDFEVTAWTEEGEIMGVRHKTWPLHGVQFHPESFLTVEGPTILRNFLALAPVG